MTDDSDPQDNWERTDTWYYRNTETGRKIHEEAYEAMKERQEIIENADVVPVEELKALAEQWEEDADNPDLSDGARHNSWQRAQELQDIIAEYRSGPE